ncbi:hypothetical protein ACFX2B_003867 [Malus domestica]
MPASIKICTRWSSRNQRGACSEIEEAFAFSKAGLLRAHEGRSQKSMSRLLSQKLGCSKTTTADALAFSKVGLLVSTCHMHSALRKLRAFCRKFLVKLANMPNLYSYSRKHSQQDCLLQNRRGTALRISRARLPT